LERSLPEVARWGTPVVLGEEIDNTVVRLQENDKAKKVGYLWEGSSEGKENSNEIGVRAPPILVPVCAND
jgi:hypothetical protein